MNRRARKLILTSFQVRCIALGSAVSLLSIVVQVLCFALLQRSDSASSTDLERSQAWVQDLLFAGCMSLAILTPFLISVGMIVTHRIAGPIYRFQEYLREVALGRVDGTCVIRRQDEFHELCTRINEAVMALEGRESASLQEEATVAPGDVLEPDLEEVGSGR